MQRCKIESEIENMGSSTINCPLCESLYDIESQETYCLECGHPFDIEIWQKFWQDFEKKRAEELAGIERRNHLKYGNCIICDKALSANDIGKRGCHVKCVPDELINHKTIIAEVTYLCNLKCKYCHVSKLDNSVFMSELTLQNMHLKVSKWNEGGETTIIWHGGEPLLAGIDFFYKVLEIQRTIPNIVFKNCIQSNGTLLTDSSFDFFDDNDLNIGFSLDGIRVAHDINRPYKNDQSSFYDTLYWIKQKIKGGAICVLNKTTIENIELIYEFSKENQLAFKYNPLFQMGRALEHDNLGLSDDELLTAYKKLFDLWHDDDPKERARIDFFDSVFQGIKIINGEDGKIVPFNCIFNNNCQHIYLCVAPNGDLYPCSRFAGEKEFLYGNINEERDLSDILDNEIRDRFLERHKGLDECKSCKYLQLCNSGCPHTAYLAYGDIMRKHSLCQVYFDFYEYVQSKI